jgi:hypothetical protein
VHYRPPQSISTVTVTHTVACSDDLNRYAVISTGEISTAVQADMSGTGLALDVKKFPNDFGSADVDVMLTPWNAVKRID